MEKRTVAPEAVPSTTPKDQLYIALDSLIATAAETSVGLKGAIARLREAVPASEQVQAQMLEALKLVTSLVRIDGTIQFSIGSDTWHAINAAIAKAEGR